ncbi:MAG TPA: DUF1778 domain-containing protein [Terriglobales bacterium]|jgi:uncharacterized protein (DUF1778 family)|nr:DUF1778 domain-containing protein [Terriglobales bacterium]
MPAKEVLRRRSLKSAIRKRVTAYYSEDEQHEIAKAAAIEGVSQSSFVASAALKEARKVLSSRRK